MSIGSPLSVRKLKILPEDKHIEAIAWIENESDEANESEDGNENSTDSDNKEPKSSEKDKFLPRTNGVSFVKIKKVYDSVDVTAGKKRKKQKPLAVEKYYSILPQVIPWRVPWMMVAISAIQVRKVIVLFL